MALINGIKARGVQDGAPAAIGVASTPGKKETVRVTRIAMNV